MLEASFVMPVKNGEKFIERTIKSLQDQTVSNIEIIVVNDHSEDKTVEIVEQMIEKDKRISLIHLKDTTGEGAGRNAGTKIAKGKVIFPVDADDPNYPNRVEVTLGELKNNSADVFYGNLMRFYLETGKKVPRQFQPFDEKTLRNINIIPHGASAYKKEVYEKIGSYDESLKIGTDYDFYLSALDNGFKFCSKNIALAQYTMHADQVTNNADPETIKKRQKWNKIIRTKHKIFSVDYDYVKNNSEPEVVEFYANKNFSIWFDEEAIPKE